MAAEGEQAATLVSRAMASDEAASWSPDGSRVALDAGGQLLVVDLNDPSGDQFWWIRSGGLPWLVR